MRRGSLTYQTESHVVHGRSSERDAGQGPRMGLLVVAYAYSADAPAQVGRIIVARAQMNRDLMIRELSAETGHQAFVIIGEPDIHILRDYPDGQIAVEVRGYRRIP